MQAAYQLPATDTDLNGQASYNAQSLLYNDTTTPLNNGMHKRVGGAP